MYKTLDEMLLEHGLKEISLDMLLGLPESEDRAIYIYLLLFQYSEEGLEYLRALWQDGVAKLTDESGEIAEKDFRKFWRFLSISPIFFSFESVDEGSVMDLLDEAWQYYRRIDEWEDSTFEELLASMPSDIVYGFLSTMEPEDLILCLTRLTCGPECCLFRIDEQVLRDVLNDAPPAVRFSMALIFMAYGVQYNHQGPIDPQWQRCSSVGAEE